MQKTANLSRVLMCVFATKTCYLTLLFLYFFYTKIDEVNRVSIDMGAISGFLFHLIKQNTSNSSDGCENSIDFVNFGVKEIKK